MKALTQTLKKEIANMAFYKQSFLQQGATSYDFFKNITYPVDLSGLCKIIKTCYYHQAFDFCPVLVELVDQQLKDHYAGNYLLQVWDKTGDVVYQKVLKYEIASWNIFIDYFTYKLHSEEDGAGYFYVVNLRKKAGTFVIKDFVQDDSFVHLGITNACFYIGNSKTIKIIDIHYTLEEGGTTNLDPTPEQILTYHIGDNCLFHGFVENKFSLESRYILALMEQADGQINVNKMFFMSREISKGDITFTEYTESLPRAIRNDPIKKFKLMFHSSQFMFGVALRQSGSVDIYWNMKKVDEINTNDFIDVDINFQYIYLRKQDGTFLKIDTKWDIRVGQDTAEPAEMDSQDWSKIHYKYLADNVVFFSSYILIKTSFFVAHQNIISVYDIITKTWVKHFFVNEKIVKVFRNEKDEDSFNLGAYLQRGKIMIFDTTNPSDTDSWNMEENNYQVNGTLQQITSDLESYRQLYMITKTTEGVTNLYGFSRKKLYIFNTLVHELKEITKVIPFFSPAKNAQFILFNNDDGKVRIYEHYWTGETFYLKTLKEYQITTPSEIKGKIHTAISTDLSQFVFFVDETNIYKFNVQTGAIKTFEDQNICGVQFIDNNYIYAMINKSSTNDKHGFYIYDIQNMLDQDLDTNYLLDNTLVGKNGVVDFSSDNERLAYMNDYEQINIVPPLHRNVINFMGMDKRKNYITTKKIKDRFLALDKQGYITSWNLMTGKLESYNKVPNIDFAEYEIFNERATDLSYKREWSAPRTLLMKVQAEEGYTDEEFYEPEQLVTELANSKHFNRSVTKTYHKYKYIEIINENTVKEHFSFIHAYYGTDKYQRIYISDNTEFMFERLVNQRVFLFQKLPYAQENGLTKFKLVKRLLRFPMDISELTYTNYLFSPDLMSYLDFDSINLSFVIKDTLTQQVRVYIPKGLMNAENQTAKQVVQRFVWVDSNTVKIISMEGIEKLVDITNGFQEMAFASVPIFDPTVIGKYKHYYLHQSSLELGDTKQRLIKKYQEYKAAYYLQGKTQPVQMYDILYNIDYSVDESKYKYVAELSFTYLHWRLIEMMKNDSKFSIDSIDDSQVLLIAYNILPGCNTILHEIYKKQSIIKEIYNKVQAIQGDKYDVPFIFNLQGQSPINVCMRNNEYKTANLFLKKLQEAPADHHGRTVADDLPEAIMYALPNISEYLDSRFLQTDQIKGIDRGMLNARKEHDYSYTTASLWDDVEEIKHRLFKPSPVDADIKIEYLDLPRLHCFNDEAGDQFFEALSETEDINLFSSRAIQILINYKWPLVREFTIKKFFVPFVIFQAIFFTYSNYIYPQIIIQGKHLQDNDDANYLNLIFSALLLPCCFYFMYFEMRQLLLLGASYLASIWNYLDLIPPIMMVFVIITTYINVDYLTEVNIYLMALTSLLMWFKFLYFLRIFKKTGYLIRMIIQVVYDMRIFLLVLLITILGFSDAFITLSQQSDPEFSFTGDRFINALFYTYSLCLGNFDTAQYDNAYAPALLYILFLLCSLLNMIVMLNLLIAIISQSFSTVNDNYELASNQERARIIAENSFLVPTFRMRQVSDPQQFILVAKEVNEDVAFSNPVEQRIYDLRVLFNNKFDSLSESLNSKLDKLVAASEKK